MPKSSVTFRRSHGMIICIYNGDQPATRLDSNWRSSCDLVVRPHRLCRAVQWVNKSKVNCGDEVTRTFLRPGSGIHNPESKRKQKRAVNVGAWHFILFNIIQCTGPACRDVARPEVRTIKLICGRKGLKTMTADGNGGRWHQLSF